LERQRQAKQHIMTNLHHHTMGPCRNPHQVFTFCLLRASSHTLRATEDHHHLSGDCFLLTSWG